MKVRFIVPCYNAQNNLATLCKSLMSQNSDNFDVTIIDDVSDVPLVLNSEWSDNRFKLVRNETRKYALRNIVETVTTTCADDDIVAIVDGDDALCNNDTVDLLLKAYSSGMQVVWTAHRWDVNGLNISSKMPDTVNPYQYKWCSSHLKTFLAGTLRSISVKNFYDHNNEWFTRAYDQALMLPLLYISKNRRLYIENVCYDYKIDSCSIPVRETSDANKQLQIVNFVRSRGYIND